MVDAVAIHARTARIQVDVVGLRIVVQGVVLAGDRHRLCLVPVAGRERHVAWTCRALARVVATHRHGNTGGRSAAQSDGEGVGATSLGHLRRTAAVDDRQARFIVVGGAGRYVDVVQGVVLGVGAAWDEPDVVGLIAVVHIVVNAGDGDGDGTVPVGGAERHGIRTDRGLAAVAAAHRNRDAGGRLGVELDGECVGPAGAGGLGDPGIRAAVGKRDAGGVVIGGACRHGYVRYGGVAAVVAVAAGRGQRDVVGLRAVVDVVVNAGDRHRLGAVPVAGRERQRARIHGCLVGGAAGHRDRHVGGRFAVQLDGERVGPATAGGLGHLRRCAAVGKRDAGGVVIGGACRHGYVRYGGVAAVVAVAAGRGQRDVVGLRAVVDVVVNAGDGHRLGAVPVAGRERQRARIHGCLVGGAAGHRDRHVGGRFAVQLDGERVGPATAGGLGHLRRCAAVGKRYPRIVGVVGGAGRHGYVRYGGVAAVVGVGAGRGQRNVVGLRAVVDVVVNAGDRHRLGAVPVAGRERQRARIHGCLVGGAAGHRDRHVGGRLSVQLDGERVGGGGLAHLRAAAANVGKRYPRIVGVVGGAGRHGYVRYGGVAAVVAVGAGRGQRDVVGLRAVVDVVVNAGDRHRLGAVPVAGRECQRARIHGCLVGGAAGHRDRHVGGRLSVQLDGERVGGGGLAHLRAAAANVGKRYPRIVAVVGGADAHGHVRYGAVTSVVGVAGAGRIQDDVVSHRAIVDVVVLTGDGDRLIIIPVARRERQTGRVYRTLIGGGATHRHRYVRRRLGVELDGEAGGTAGLGRLPRHRAGGDAGRIVIGGADGHVDVIQAVIDAVAVHARTARVEVDVVGYRAVVAGVVNAGDGDGLIIIPVARRERQAGGACRALVGGVTAHRHGDVGGRFARQFDGEGVGAAGLAHLRRTAAVLERDAGRIGVVGGAGRHGYVRYGGVAAVVAVAAGRGQRDVVGLRAVVDVVVNAGDRHRLGAVPVAGRECQRARIHGCLVGGAAGHRDRHVGGRRRWSRCPA